MSTTQKAAARPKALHYRPVDIENEHVQSSIHSACRSNLTTFADMPRTEHHLVTMLQACIVPSGESSSGLGY